MQDAIRVYKYYHFSKETICQHIKHPTSIVHCTIDNRNNFFYVNESLYQDLQLETTGYKKYRIKDGNFQEFAIASLVTVVYKDIQNIYQPILIPTLPTPKLGSLYFKNPMLLPTIY